jgi:hypothetical protein
MLVLDALQPVGVTRLMLDPYGLIPALGALAHLEPLAAVHVLQDAGLDDLGMVLAPIGRVKAGQAALHINIKVGEQEHEEVVRSGALRLVASPSGREATVTVRPHRRLDLGRGNGRAVTFTLPAGSRLGLICDTRGRPLLLPRTPEERARAFPRWTAQAMGQEAPEVDLDTAPVEISAPAEPEPEVVEAEEAAIAEADLMDDLDTLRAELTETAPDDDLVELEPLPEDKPKPRVRKLQSRRKDQ